MGLLRNTGPVPGTRMDTWWEVIEWMIWAVGAFRLTALLWSMMRSGWWVAGRPIIFDAVWVILMSLVLSPTESTVREQMEKRRRAEFIRLKYVFTYAQYCLCASQRECMAPISLRVCIYVDSLNTYFLTSAHLASDWVKRHDFKIAGFIKFQKSLDIPHSPEFEFQARFNDSTGTLIETHWPFNGT